MPGTYRLVQCAQKIGRSWALILEGEYFGDKSLLAIRAELQPYPVQPVGGHHGTCTVQ